MTPAMQKFLIAGVVLVPLAFLLGAWNAHGAFSDEVAAWAQAIGGVAAVTAAFTIASAGHRESRLRDERQALSLLSAAYAAAAEGASAISVFTTAIAKHDSPNPRFLSASFDMMFRDSIASIDSVPKHLLDRPEAVASLLAAKMILQQTRGLVPEISEHARTKGAFDKAVIPLLSDRARAVRKTAKAIGDLLPPELRLPRFAFVDQEYDPITDGDSGPSA